MRTFWLLKHSHQPNAPPSAGSGVKVSAMPAGNSITRAPQPMDGSSGEDTMPFIIGTTGLVPTLKRTTLPLHGWLNTFSRHFRISKESASPMPGAEQSIPAHVSVHFGALPITAKRLMSWDTPDLV